MLQFGGRCHSQTEVRKFAKEQGLPVHGATFPLALAKFLIEYLTRPGDTMVDNFAGWFTGPLAAELTGRRWVASADAAVRRGCPAPVHGLQWVQRCPSPACVGELIPIG